MDKLTKIGFSALCGSLASVAAAHAGELAVTGGATTTYVSNSVTVTGNPIGLSSGILFTGTGELDNGTAFTLTLSQTDQSAYSVGSITLDTPSMGSIKISQATGGVGIDVKDDAMPTAWEETDGAGLTTGHDKISGVGGSMSVQWKSPVMANSTIAIAYTPKNDGALVNDKAASGGAKNANRDKGWGVLLDINSSHAGGLPNVFAGYSTTEQAAGGTGTGTNADPGTDAEEAVAGGTLVIGPLKLGAQASVEWLGNETAVADVVGYRNIAYGVSFNVSDNLSLSYGYHESKRGLVDIEQANSRVTSEAESIQIAYTMGGASFKIASNEVENASYSTATSNDTEGTTLALSLAF